MKRFYTIIAAALLGISSVSAQTMTITIEGKEVKNGDDIVVKKAANETVLNPALKMYDLGVDVKFKSLVAQTVETEGIDLDQVTPGLACCPTGFTCTTANASNGWVSSGTMTNLTAGQEVNGEWIHYNYGANKKPADGTVRKSKITFKGATETITFNLTIDTNVSAGINDITVDEADAPAYNIAGQRISAPVKGIIIKNGKKYVAKP